MKLLYIPSNVSLDWLKLWISSYSSVMVNTVVSLTSNTWYSWSSFLFITNHHVITLNFLLIWFKSNAKRVINYNIVSFRHQLGVTFVISWVNRKGTDPLPLWNWPKVCLKTLILNRPLSLFKTDPNPRLQPAPT